MDTETTATPAGGEDTSVEDTLTPDTEADTEVQTDEPQLDDDGNPIEDKPEPEEEEEEIDLEDLKLKLRKSEAEKLKPYLLRQEDYTRKTMALADDRKAFEAERDAYSKSSEEEQTARANLHVIDAQYMQINAHVQKTYGSWEAFYDAEPIEAAKLDGQARRLETAFNQTKAHVANMESERQSKQQQTEAAERQRIATLLDQGTPELKAAIPDWSAAKAAKLLTEASQKFGIPADDIAGADKPGHFLMLNAAMNWLEHQAKTKKAQTIQQQQEVKPAASVTRSSAPPKGVDDRLTTDEWMRRRNAQDRKRA